MNIWRIHANTDSKGLTKIADYCVENKIIAMGWSLKDKHLQDYVSSDLYQQAVTERDTIKTFDDYSEFVKKFGIYKSKVDENVIRLHSEIEENDLVWIRSGGIYYLGRVTKNSRWIYNNSQEALELDASNQYTEIEWHRIGDENDIPGAVATSFIRGKTFQRIHKPGVSELSKWIYNEKSGNNLYKGKDIKSNEPYEEFYSLLSTDDCEDLLCLWLYSEFGYIAIPSTNKRATELYECVLKDPKTGKNIYIQVKAGEDDLDKTNYKHLKDAEIWLFTARGKINGEDINNNIKIAEPKVIYEFVNSGKADKILSQSIQIWREKLNSVLQHK